MPKRKRILSAKLHSKKNQKITKQAPDCVEETSASLNGSGPCVRQLFQSRSATSYVSNAVLKSNLKSTLSKLSAANSTIIDQDKKLSAISKKASDLTGIVRRNRAATKEARLSLATAARDAETKIKKVQATAAASVDLVEVNLQKLQAIIDKKDSELQTQKHQYECHIRSAVSTAVEKERVRLENISIYLLFSFMYTYLHCSFVCIQERSARALLVAASKSASQLSRTLKDHALELGNKNKEIKVKCNVCYYF